VAAPGPAEKIGSGTTNAPAEAMTVAEMQKILLDLGYRPGPVDGAIGKRTVDALKKFQQANKLQATGIMDPDTVARLRTSQKGR